MKIIADTHTHTVASEHAYSTLMENVQVAKSKGIKFLAITDHTGQMIGAPSQAYFTCMQAGIPHLRAGSLPLPLRHADRHRLHRHHSPAGAGPQL